MVRSVPEISWRRDYSRGTGRTYKAPTNSRRGGGEQFRKVFIVVAVHTACHRLEDCCHECCLPCTASNLQQFFSTFLFEPPQLQPYVTSRPADAAAELSFESRRRLPVHPGLQWCQSENSGK